MSQGAKGLPHYRNSRTAVEMGEPIYMNLWEFDITLPDSLQNAAAFGSTTDTKNLLLENITKVGGLSTWKVPSAGVSQRYKLSTRKFANSGLDDTTTELTLEIQLNIMYDKTGGSTSPDLSVVKLLRAWTDLVYNPLTGLQGLKIHYVAPQCKLILHDREYNPVWQWTLYNVFPTSGLTNMNFSYDSQTETLKLTDFKLQCDYFDEAIIGDGISPNTANK